MGLETKTDLIKDGKVNESAVTEFVIDTMIDISKKFELQQNIELDVYYDISKKSNNELFTVGDPLKIVEDEETLEANKDNFQRVATLGGLDLTTLKIIRIVDKDLGVYELDDGQGIKHNLAVYQNLDKRKLKRSFIDSSFGIESDMKAFLLETALAEKWFDGVTASLDKAIKLEKAK